MADKITEAVRRFDLAVTEYLEYREVSALRTLLATLKVGGDIDINGHVVSTNDLEQAVADRGGNDKMVEVEKPSTGQRDLIKSFIDFGMLDDDVDTKRLAETSLENFGKIPQRGRAAQAA